MPYEFGPDFESYRSPEERRRDFVLTWVGIIAVGLIVLALVVSQRSDSNTQYCWDTGDPAPHHLGRPVEGDHVCTDEELSNYYPPGDVEAPN